MMTTCLPSISTPLNASSAWMPAGVHGIGASTPMTRRPRFTGWRPSASLFGSIARSAPSSSSPFGSGSCTMKPWMSGFALQRSIAAITSACVAEAGRSSRNDAMPTSAQSSCFMRT